MADKSDNIQFFSEERIALQREVRNYWFDTIGQVLAMQEDKSWEGQLATIAAMCGVLLDGMYTPIELDKLADQLIWKLRWARGNVKVAPNIGVKLTVEHVSKPSPEKDITPVKGNDTKH